MLAVALGVVTAGFRVVFLCVAGVAMGAVRVMRSLFVIAGLMVPGRFAMMFGCMLMVFGSLVMMVLDALVIAHVTFSSLWVCRQRIHTQVI